MGGWVDGPQNQPNRRLRSNVSRNHGHFTGATDTPAGAMQRLQQKRFSICARRHRPVCQPFNGAYSREVILRPRPWRRVQASPHGGGGPVRTLGRRGDAETLEPHSEERQNRSSQRPPCAKGAVSPNATQRSGCVWERRSDGANEEYRLRDLERYAVRDDEGDCNLYYLHR